MSHCTLSTTYWVLSPSPDVAVAQRLVSSGSLAQQASLHLLPHTTTWRETGRWGRSSRNAPGLGGPLGRFRFPSSPGFLLSALWRFPKSRQDFGSSRVRPLPEGKEEHTLPFPIFPTQGSIFPTQGLNPGPPHCRWIFYQLSYQGSPSSPKEVDSLDPKVSFNESPPQRVMLGLTGLFPLPRLLDLILSPVDLSFPVSGGRRLLPTS